MPFKYRLAATIFALQTILIVVIIWQSDRILSLGDSRQDEIHEFHSVDILQVLGKIALSGKNKLDLQTYLSLEFANEQYAYVVVVDIKGIVIAAVPESLIGSKFSPELNGQGLHDKGQVISEGKRQLGAYYYQLADTSPVLNREKSRNRIIYTAVVGLVFIGFIGLFLSNLLSRRIENLATTAARLSAGDWSARVDASGGGEIEAVGRALNEMAENASKQVAALAESEEQYRALVELSPDAILINEGGKLTFVNLSAASLFGAGSVDELIGRDVTTLLHPDDRSVAAQGVRRLYQGDKANLIELRWLRLDGSIVISETTGQVFDHQGERGIVTVIRDITERRRTEEHQRQSQRLEAIGQLTGGVAHDFNNLLAVVIWNLEVLREELEGDEDKLETLDRASRASERGADLVRQLLAFSRKQALKTMPLDLNHSINQTLELVSSTLGENIEISLDLDDNLWSAAADPVQIENVILNLAINSRDAMPDGGTLTIKTENVSLDGPAVIDNSPIEAGEYASISITDSGSGMTPEVIDRALEPFFTTKLVGQGTGLGLSTVYGFVKQSKGFLAIRSTLEQGTTITILLPRLSEEDAVDTAEVDDNEVSPQGQGETILVVEDNPEVLHSVKRIIGGFGYEVRSATTGSEAIELIEELRIGDIDLMLTDIGLAGGMDGWEVAARARRLLPGLKVIYMSGYADNVLAHGDLEQNQKRLLRKPFRRAELGRRLREVLDEENG
jgi:PAS domain S-box-containing protein